MNTKINDAVPVAWLIHWSNIPLEAPEVTTSASRVDAVSALTGPPRIEPLYTHPQPAALNEVSGNSGELGGDERARFEAWAPNGHLNVMRNPDGDYIFSTTQTSWVAWQAAVAARQPVGQEPEYIRDVHDVEQGLIRNPKCVPPAQGIDLTKFHELLGAARMLRVISMLKDREDMPHWPDGWDWERIDSAIEKAQGFTMTDGRDAGTGVGP